MIGTRTELAELKSGRTSQPQPSLYTTNKIQQLLDFVFMKGGQTFYWIFFLLIVIYLAT